MCVEFQNYTGKDFVSCPFNAKHEMPKPEIRHHVAVCPDKAVLDPELDFCMYTPLCQSCSLSHMLTLSHL